MRNILVLFILVSIAFASRAFAQDTLPKISVKNINNQVIVSWKNNYGAKISNINIQRSRDSLKNFITIGTVLNPLNKENGFVDRKVTSLKFYYRVFVGFEGGTYLFSKSHRPITDTVHIYEKTIAEVELAEPVETSPIISKAPTVVIKAPVVVFEEPAIIVKEEPIESFLPKVKIPKIIVPAGFVASKYIYTNKENNLVISLPDADKVKFSLRFFDDADKFLFEIKKIKEPYLLMEKVNFIHSGWFYYNLYDDGIFLERYKFYIAREGHAGPPPPEGKKIMSHQAP